MARPQTYTDSEIIRAIQALMAEGGTVNPMRVKRRLGGGNVSRIKALIEERSRPRSKKSDELPADLMRALERLVRETVLHARALSADYDVKVLAGDGKKRAAARSVGHRITELETGLVNARQKIVQLEAQQAQDCETITAQRKERNSTAETIARLHAALRNAESDLRAAQRIIDTFERNQRQDREDVRELQKHNENLVAELAVLKAGQQLERKKSRRTAPGR